MYRGSRIENRVSRIENRVSRIENRLSILEDQKSRFDTEFWSYNRAQERSNDPSILTPIMNLHLVLRDFTEVVLRARKQKNGFS